MPNSNNLLDLFSLGWGLLWRTSIAFILVQIFLIGFGQYFHVSANNILILGAEDIVKIKPTISYFALLLLLLVVRLLSSRSLVFAFIGYRLHLSADQWMRFDYSLMGILAVIGVLNIVTAFFMSTDTWVSFKLFGSSLLYLCSFPLIAAWLRSDKKR